MAARQRLQAYLQQQSGISRAKAAELAGKLSAVLGAAADQLVPAPLQWLVGRGMQPLKAVQLVVRVCGNDASFMRQWPTWQPVFAANWQLADSRLAAYQQQCKAAKQRPLKGSTSMAVLLSGQPSRYRLLLLPDLPSKLKFVQQLLGKSEAEIGEMIAAGLVLTGTKATLAAAIQWLVSFAGSKDGAVSMLRQTPELLSFSAATLDSKVAALQAAWAGKLQPEQLRQLVQRASMVLTKLTADKVAPTADVLRSWFPQPSEAQAVLAKCPQLLAAPAASLQASKRYFMGPPLSLSRQQFLALVAARPQPFFMNLAGPLTQHKLAFLTQVCRPFMLGHELAFLAALHAAAVECHCCITVFLAMASKSNICHKLPLSVQVASVPVERALSKSHLTYLKSGLTALAGRYFLLTEHGVPLPRHKDGGVVLTYAVEGLPHLLRRMRLHDSQRRLPADDDAALEYVEQWLAAWPATDSGRQWAQPPQPAADA